MSAEVSPPPVLAMTEVEASYGPFRALFDVSFRIGPGEAIGLLGANGAGKTAVARVAGGLLPPTAGTVVVDGVDMGGENAYKFARAGVAHAPEGRSVFATFTVEENLALSFRRALGRSGVKSGLSRAFEIFPRLGERRSQLAGTLSGGEQRMLSLARVMVEEPRLLIADELSLGLAPIIIEEVYKVLHSIRQAVASLLVVEQHATHALSLCDRIVVLDHGRVVWEGPSDEALGAIESSLFKG